MTNSGSEPNGSDAVAALRRWIASGGQWQVLSRTRSPATVSLFPCTGGEEVDRITSDDPAFLRYLDDLGAGRVVDIGLGRDSTAPPA